MNKIIDCSSCEVMKSHNIILEGCENVNVSFCNNICLVNCVNLTIRSQRNYILTDSKYKTEIPPNWVSKLEKDKRSYKGEIFTFQKDALNKQFIKEQIIQQEQKDLKIQKRKEKEATKVSMKEALKKSLQDHKKKH